MPHLNRSTIASFACLSIMTSACTSQESAQVALPEVICGVENVEDLVDLPGRWIIGSGIGDNFFQSGALHLINEDNAAASKISLNLPSDLVAQAPFDQCPGPVSADVFSAHGLSLLSMPGGGQRLFVVNHGGRESIEVFDVDLSGEEPRLSWTGCVLTPDSATSNAVSARPDGSLVMSASSASDTPMPSFAALAANPPEMSGAGSAAHMPKGAVFTWSRDEGWNKVPGSELDGNNGIELSEDGQWAFVNSWPGESVTYMPLDPSLGEAREIKLAFKPDNIRRGYDGRLVATGHRADVATVATCVMGDASACEIDYSAAAIDPDTFEVTPLHDGRGTPEFGTATIALNTERALWFGSVRSQCILRVPK